ncbi:hypothetical protein TrVE_jg8737 [Triparma verrucosa]|uniref:RNA 3'-terminal phosphate cyclase-like protein n=1 Tax=Triparma verrucosa TaxID=1606542 RepID=A0A9W7EHM2_9STRA|nr:hypothetical protein TrVE_jg8737 [Triparma verrucosa]
MSSSPLRFDDGPVQFRQRVICSILSRRPLLVKNIRHLDQDPGLRDYEASFLRLIDSLTNGTSIEINETGSQFKMRPGIVINGEVSHDCSVSRSIGWFLEGVLPLASFGKRDLKLTLTGVTDGYENEEVSIDYIKASMLPVLKEFGVGADESEGPGAMLRVTRRGAAPGGGGSVEVFCPMVKALTPINIVDPGMIKKIRGNAVSCRIPPTSPARVAHAAKGILHKLIPDVWIHTDTNSGSKTNGPGGCGESPGLKCILSAESTTGVTLSAEVCLDYRLERGAVLPEDLGVQAATLLLDEVRKGGCVDSACQSFIFLLMCLTPEDVSRVRVGVLSRYSVTTLRLLKQVFGVEMKVTGEGKVDGGGDVDGGGVARSVLLSCLGIGFRNVSKSVT